MLVSKIVCKAAVVQRWGAKGFPAGDAHHQCQVSEGCSLNDYILCSINPARELCIADLCLHTIRLCSGHSMDRRVQGHKGEGTAAICVCCPRRPGAAGARLGHPPHGRDPQLPLCRRPLPRCCMERALQIVERMLNTAWVYRPESTGRNPFGQS